MKVPIKMYTFYHLDLTAGLSSPSCSFNFYLFFQPEVSNFTERLSCWHELHPSIEAAQASQAKIELEWTEEAERRIHLPFALKWRDPNNNSAIRKNINYLVEGEKESVWKNHPADSIPASEHPWVLQAQQL